eukprot:SAG31_NODE_40081_length_283_cov_1.076087_1_plen_42_part_01
MKTGDAIFPFGLEFLSGEEPYMLPPPAGRAPVSGTGGGALSA